jgi:HTH-like domain
MVTPAVRREAVAHLQVAYEVSERRACSAVGTDRTSVRYRSRRPDDTPVRARLRELASIRRRFGYRRLHILLRREGIVMNHKKLRRLYREERLPMDSDISQRSNCNVRVRPGTSSGITKFSEHEADGCEAQECERLVIEILPIFGKPSASVEPSNGSLDQPTCRS